MKMKKKEKNENNINKKVFILLQNFNRFLAKNPFLPQPSVSILQNSFKIISMRKCFDATC